MANVRLTINGYGQVELNNAAFRRDGRIEAQSKPNATDFATRKLENGMILAVDKVANEVKLPVAVTGEGAVDRQIYALVYSAEHIYDERKVGLKDYYNGVDGGEFYPRVGYLSVQDIFTSNCISYNGSTYSDDAAFKAAIANATTGYKGSNPWFAGIDTTNGSILITGTTAPTQGPVLKVIEVYTMPDGQYGIKFQVIAC